jgi:hypothetical protein
MKKNYSLPLFALILFLAVPGLIAQDESVLSNIHKRLSTPGYESRHDHDRMLFVGEVIALGPVFQGVCKSAVAQSVDFSVSEILLGDPPEPTVHAAYTNCTRVPLPSPPFTLHAKVIVYCFHNVGFKCLAPVTFTDDRLKKVRSWIAGLSAENHGTPPLCPMNARTGN